jgi:hypothetical protein
MDGSGSLTVGRWRRRLGGGSLAAVAARWQRGGSAQRDGGGSLGGVAAAVALRQPQRGGGVAQRDGSGSLMVERWTAAAA